MQQAEIFKRGIRLLLLAGGVLGLLFVGIQASFAVTNINEDVADLEDQIKNKESELSDLTEKIETYKSTIRERQLESLSLESQISLLEADIDVTDAEIKEKEAQIEVLTLEIEKFEIRIEDTEADIDVKKEQLRYYLLTIYKNDRVTPLEIALTNNQFSEFFRQIEFISTLQGEFQATLDDIQSLKKVLESQQSSIEVKAAELEDEQESLVGILGELEGEQSYKNDLLIETQESEEQFQSLVEDAQNQQEAANNAIYSLEQEVRDKLKQKEQNGGEEDEIIILPSELSFIWPVPSRQITAGFRDGDYPFKRYFEHSAIDIRAPQGTPIKATETGVVGIAKDAGMGYSYIMLVHGSGFSSVYGHVSAIYVGPGDYVQKGEVIGLSGATPGTPGAGIFTTGPHLHFEIRINGLPVDPVLYLP